MQYNKILNTFIIPHIRLIFLQLLQSKSKTTTIKTAKENKNEGKNEINDHQRLRCRDHINYNNKKKSSSK